jgi:adenosylcobyric acid synthase
MKQARAIAVLGTASDVGKSLIATALGRLLADAGIDVAPFKAQNMALQAGVTPEGGEMGRAQILQARACRQVPHVDMNPVLLKPESDTGAQVVVLGKATSRTTAKEYFGGPRNPLADVAEAALLRLASRHEAIVLEGAGSPVEVNLMARDFVNLSPARRLEGKLILVADIDRGGVFAQVKGTVELLPDEDRARLLGIIVNRFRGDPTLFEDGIATLEQLAGVPVLAVVPWLRHGLDEEDRPPTLPIDAPPVPGALNVGVILHPRVANTEDIAPLVAEPDVAPTWITGPSSVAGRDLLVLPGTKTTIADLVHHTATGTLEAVRRAWSDGAWLLGICGGYQMLGARLEDPAHIEGPVAAWPGLAIFDALTRFAPDKTLSQRHVTSAWPEPGHALEGYEIHHGQTSGTGVPLAQTDGATIGLVAERAVGTYLHGVLYNDGWRAAFLARVREDRGLPPSPPVAFDPLDTRIDRWARHVASALRPGAWERILAAIAPATALDGRPPRS